MSEHRQLAIVSWVDSCGGNDWCAADQVHRRPVVVQSVGWVLERTDEAICVASSIGTDTDQIG